MKKPHLRNPGPWSFAIFACACALVGGLHFAGAAGTSKLAAELVALAVAAFGARSALGAATGHEHHESSSSAPPPLRTPMPTWPGDDEEPRR